MKIKVRVIEKRDGNQSYFFIKATTDISFAKDIGGKEVRAWCLENFGPEGDRWNGVINMITFKDDNDACAFKLRWL